MSGGVLHYLDGGPWDKQIARLRIEPLGATMVFRVGKWVGRYKRQHDAHKKRIKCVASYPVAKWEWASSSSND
jgi:hypothetical protein